MVSCARFVPRASRRVGDASATSSPTRLREGQFSWAGSITGHWAYGIAFAVFAYEHGGAAAVGLVG